MGRIAGIIGRPGGAPIREETVRAMLRHCDAGEAIVASLDGACLAAVGPGSGIAVQGDLVLALDGRLFDGMPASGAMAGHDDAARLLELCARRGVAEALAAVAGDLAVAVFDRGSQRAWLGRDRFGLRPPYHAETAGSLAFCSVPAPLARLDGVGLAVNRSYVARIAGSHYRTFDNAPAESPFARVAQLPAAHVAERGPEGTLYAKRYWTLLPADLVAADEDALAEQLRGLLQAAVARRLAAVARPGFTLSGGMDSSSVAATAGRILGRRPLAFSSVYRDPVYDERAEIRDMVEAGLVDWVPVEIGDEVDVLAAVSRLVRAHNEPVATATWLSHDAVCREVAARGCTALFGGLGGDELNAGEYEYFPLFFADLAAAGVEQQLAAELDAWAHHHDHPIHRKSPSIGRAMMASATVPGSRGLVRPDLARLLRYAGTVRRDFFDLEAFRPVMEHPFDGFLANRAFQDLTRETTPCCLRAEDRHAALHGIERFDPFLDTALVEFMFAVPPQLKIRDGVTKQLLRRAMRGVLPEATRTRVKKTGWNAPAHVWFARPEGIAALRDLIASRRFRERGIYVPAEVDRIITEHAEIVTAGATRENHMMFLWQMVNLEAWLDWVDDGAR